MAPKRRLDERRKLQNREAQRRFRERAKQKIGIQKNDSSKGVTTKNLNEEVEDKHSRLVKAFTKSPSSSSKEKNEEKRQSFDSIYSSSSSTSSNSTLSSQEGKECNLAGCEILQSALMTSLSNLTQEMDRCDKEEILKSLKIPSILQSTTTTSQSNPNNLLFIDSNSPSDSSSSIVSSSNQSNHSITTTQWIELPTSFENSTIGGEEYLTTITTSPPTSNTIIHSNNFIQQQPSIDNWSQMIEESVDFPSFPYFEQNQFQIQQQQSCLFNLPLIEPTLQQREQQQSNFTSCNDEIEKWKKSMTNETFNRFFNGLV